MARLRFAVAYDGAAFHGWQIQPDTRTVEGELTRAAAQILGAAAADLKVQGASRTDAGVHALGQVCHLDHGSSRTVWDFVRGLNALTDDDVTVVFGDEAPDGFHARHSSRGKRYRYRLWTHRFPHPLRRGTSWKVPYALDRDLLQEAAAALVGVHDFSGFRASDCQATTTVREIWRVEHVELGPGLSEIVVEGSAFLKNMVRIIAGTLVDVARGQLPADRVATLLSTGDRRLAGQTAPPQGLMLDEVFYPEHPWPIRPQLGGPHLRGNSAGG